jgi:hypothetical protein
MAQDPQAHLFAADYTWKHLHEDIEKGLIIGNYGGNHVRAFFFHLRHAVFAEANRVYVTGACQIERRFFWTPR